MTYRLHWKLLLITTVPVILIIIGVVWFAFDNLAADYFMVLMDKYMVSPTETHRAFLDAVHRYLLWAGLLALILAFLLSYFLTRKVLSPLAAIHTATREVAAGNFSRRIETASKDEVGELAQAFNRMADSLARLEQLRKNMVADVAHELRTPLTNLRGYFEALSDEVIPPSGTTFEMLQDETLRLVHLVENLQQLARADAARAFLDKRLLSLSEVVGQMLDLYWPQIEAKDITVETKIPPAADEVRADREKLLQAIRNLLENAWKYSPESGRVEISGERRPTGIRLIFSNSGADIAPDALPFIFERFFRADRSRSRSGGGAGIGLAIVKELIEAHGGKVGAESGGGRTRIWFELPD